MTGRYPTSVRVRVLRVARSTPRLTVQQIAARAGCHPDTARRHLSTVRFYPPGRAVLAAQPRLTSAEASAATRLAIAEFDEHAAAERAASRLGAYHAHSELRERGLDRFRDDPDTAAAAAASRPSCPPDLLDTLSRHRRNVRRNVAGNINCPSRLLSRLAADPDSRVRCAAARNPACPAGSLAMLARDPGWGALDEISGHSPEAVEATRRDVGYRVRTAVAGNPNTSARTLKWLAQDPQSVVRAAAEASLRRRQRPGRSRA